MEILWPNLQKKVQHHFVATNPEGSPTMEDKQEHSAFVISHFLHSACFQPHSIARLASASIHFLCSTSRITSICGMPSVLYCKKKLKNMNKSFLDAWRSLWPTSELTVCAIGICDSTRMQLLYLLKIFLTKWWITPGMLQPKFQNVTMSMRPFTWLSLHTLPMSNPVIRSWLLLSIKTQLKPGK